MDMLDKMLCEQYAGRHDPNRHALQAPIHITDLANLALRQEREIADLKLGLDLALSQRNELLSMLADEQRSTVKFAASHGVQDDGSSKFIP